MSGTGNPPGLDLVRLREHLDHGHPGLVCGPLAGELIEGGRSNLTYAVTDGTSRWVVRRPPLGHVLATAHDMAREYRVISALYPTEVPVPEPILFCDDPSVLAADPVGSGYPRQTSGSAAGYAVAGRGDLAAGQSLKRQPPGSRTEETGKPGAPASGGCQVMDYVDGVAYRATNELVAIGPERTRRVVLGLVDTLVTLHTVDPEAVGLSDFGRPEGYLERQLRRWGKQLAASRSRDLPGIDDLLERLGTSLPVSGPAAVVHGDYKLDNVLVGPDDTIRAILDWEMSTLGDPLTDLGLLVMYSEREATAGSPVAALGAAPGYPSPAELVERYAAGSGREVSAIAWYTAFAYFKLAVIAEGIHYRYTLGQTLGAGFDRIGALVPGLVDRGLSTLQEG